MFPKEFEQEKYPIAALPFHQFMRPVLRCVIQLPINLKVTVFVVHLKSKVSCLLLRAQCSLVLKHHAFIEDLF